MGTAVIIVIFYLRVLLLRFQYLSKGTFLETEILELVTTHLGLHIDKVSLKSVTSMSYLSRNRSQGPSITRSKDHGYRMISRKFR
jgi:hypothetical protein